MPDTTLLRTFVDNAEAFGELGVASCLLCRSMRLKSHAVRIECDVFMTEVEVDRLTSADTAHFRKRAASCQHYDCMQP
jgi:hypothetical protein